jgi:hypothetical protein
LGSANAARLWSLGFWCSRCNRGGKGGAVFGQRLSQSDDLCWVSAEQNCNDILQVLNLLA